MLAGWALLMATRENKRASKKSPHKAVPALTVEDGSACASMLCLKWQGNERQGVCVGLRLLGPHVRRGCLSEWRARTGRRNAAWPGGVQPLEPRQILNIRRELETGARRALRKALFKTQVRGFSLLTAGLHENSRVVVVMTTEHRVGGKTSNKHRKSRVPRSREAVLATALAPAADSPLFDLLSLQGGVLNMDCGNLR